MSEQFSWIDYIKSITETKQKLDISDYNPFMVNRGLSQHADLIFDVVEMNKYFNLPANMQYDYYINRVRKFKRYGKKWGKVEKNLDLELVMDVYKYSREKAKAALKILSKEDLEYLKEMNFHGGVAK